MAFAPSLAKKWYEDLPVEELEKKYKEIMKEFCFDSKEEQIEHIIKNCLHVSSDTNNNSIRIALEELLKEKTGKEYKIEPKEYNISIVDIINFITNNIVDSNLKDILINYFEKLTDVDEEEKKRFLIQLIQDKNLFNDFIDEITNTNNIYVTYDKYKEKVRSFMFMNEIIA